MRARLAAERAWTAAPDPAPEPGPEPVEGPGDPGSYDARLAAAVVHFQRWHGLAPDGVVGAGTVSAMNVPVEDRIAQLEVTLERWRWRWLPQQLGERHIRVNIPGFTAEVYEGDSPVIRMRAIVGREYRETPVFSARMTHLVFAPFWHVPPTIAPQDKLPLIKGDPGYLAAQHMTLFSTATNRPADPGSVDWSAITGLRFNREYRLRQDPGLWNAIGDVKFMFPNQYNVYLHDTPARELFERAVRDFSSGCMRIDQPLRLGAWLLRDRPEWTPERMREVIACGRETTVVLSEPVAVHVFYLTVFVDPDSGVSFVVDLYGRDARVQRGLAAAPPS